MKSYISREATQEHITHKENSAKLKHLNVGRINFYKKQKQILFIFSFCIALRTTTDLATKAFSKEKKLFGTPYGFSC